METRLRKPMMLKNSASHCLCLSVLLSLFVAPLRAEDLIALPTATDAALEELEVTLVKMAKNLSDQEKAWPTRDEDQANEIAAPANVRALQRRYAKLVKKKKDVLRRIEEGSRKDLGAVLHVLSKAQKKPALMDSLAPVVGEFGRQNPNSARVLIALAQKVNPCPPSIITALGELRTKKASLFLLKFGKKEKDLRMMVAAVKGNNPAVIAHLISLADGGRDEELVTLSRKVLARIAPSGQNESKLENLIAARMLDAKSVELKTALVIYLGLTKNEKHFAVLKSTYETTTNEHVRLSVIGALGNFGFTGTWFIHEQLEDPDLSIALRKRCFQALGSARYRGVTPTLLAAVGDPQLRHDAVRALERISGQRLGQQAGTWERWWRSQPDSGTAADPDIDAE